MNNLTLEKIHNFLQNYNFEKLIKKGIQFTLQKNQKSFNLYIIPDKINNLNENEQIFAYSAGMRVYGEDLEDINYHITDLLFVESINFLNLDSHLTFKLKKRLLSFDHTYENLNNFSKEVFDKSIEDYIYDRFNKEIDLHTLAINCLAFVKTNKNNLFIVTEDVGVKDEDREELEEYNPDDFDEENL